MFARPRWRDGRRIVEDVNVIGRRVVIELNTALGDLAPGDSAGRRQLAIALLVLVCYLGGIGLGLVLGPRLPWLPSSLVDLAESHAGLTRVLAKLGSVLPAFLILIVALLVSPKGSLASALRPASATRFIVVLATTTAIGIGLHEVGLFPYSWPPGGAEGLTFEDFLLQTGQPGALFVWALWKALGAPLIEEVSFRYGLLRLIAWKSNSTMSGLVFSSMVFAALHLRVLDGAYLVFVAAVFIEALGLAVLTIRARGNISDAIAVHIAVNSLPLVAMLLPVLRLK